MCLCRNLYLKFILMCYSLLPDFGVVSLKFLDLIRLDWFLIILVVCIVILPVKPCLVVSVLMSKCQSYCNVSVCVCLCVGSTFGIIY